MSMETISKGERRRRSSHIGDCIKWRIKQNQDDMKGSQKFGVTSKVT